MTPLQEAEYEHSCGYCGYVWYDKEPYCDKCPACLGAVPRTWINIAYASAPPIIKANL